jgi:hypothetical protein
MDLEDGSPYRPFTLNFPSHHPNTQDTSKTTKTSDETIPKSPKILYPAIIFLHGYSSGPKFSAAITDLHVAGPKTGYLTAFAQGIFGYNIESS